MGKRLRVGVFGLGIGKFHVEGWDALTDEGVDIVALCDLDPEKLRYFRDQLAERHVKGPEIYQDYRTMLRQAQVDAVSICTPNHLHEEIAVAAFEAGCHVLLEKPMAHTLKSAQVIHAAWKKSGKVGMAALNNNYTLRFLATKDMIGRGEVNKIQRIRGWWTRRTGVPFDGLWFTTNGLSGGGPGIDLMPHLLGYGLGLLGWPEVTTVWAESSSDLNGNPARGPYGSGKHDPMGTSDVEKSISMRCLTSTGVTMDMEAAWGRHTDSERMGFEIIGSAGSIFIERVWPVNDGSDVSAIDTWQFRGARLICGNWINFDTTLDPDKNPAWADPYMGRTKTQPEFLQCIKSGGVPATSLDDMLALQTVIEAAYRSAHALFPINIEDMKEGILAAT